MEEHVECSTNTGGKELSLTMTVSIDEQAIRVPSTTGCCASIQPLSPCGFAILAAATEQLVLEYLNIENELHNWF